MTLVRWLDELGQADDAIAGGKGAALGEMTRAGLPVPPGFVVTVDALRRYYEASRLPAVVHAQLARLDIEDRVALGNAAGALQNLMRSAPLPEDVATTIRIAYGRLSARVDATDAYVAVRSSAIVEDTGHFSFAGMFQSFLNVHGPNEVIRRVRDCWFSAFGARALYYRIKHGLGGEATMAVLVQAMIDAEKAGVLFTTDPVSCDPNLLVIEAAWGLGEVVVNGLVIPDQYQVDKACLAVSELPGHKDFMLATDERTGANVRITLPEEKSAARVLTEDEVCALNELGRRVEAHYGAAQDLEWAIAKGNVYLLQTRPITALGAKPPPPPGGLILLAGLGASPGVARGTVRVLSSPDEGDRFRAGDILVATRTTPDWVPIMRRAGAIVTDAGGMASHAAIIAREFDVPCIVGTREATKLLVDGSTVTVDARDGTVTAGA